MLKNNLTLLISLDPFSYLHDLHVCDVFIQFTGRNRVRYPRPAVSSQVTAIKHIVLLGTLVFLGQLVILGHLVLSGHLVHFGNLIPLKSLGFFR